ncbi:L-ribulose-5-phosphate 3-epimerase UlaE [Centipeda periodontii DSM 2778]|uniref:L-ribulose-5-phosphate 3-epimerase n=1 Tax=Centipeda periodontii DSM 2778 TaxID=888060 RepID=F5RPL2_9FIRM|nr:L-ribulose-5-phosphate 3-epimerase [Centipeda periodontii]EGK57680.1 L-ribulose-5-phosphate 3-epimerase UlaE [Centipeda periodontii DSM 2778]
MGKSYQLGLYEKAMPSALTWREKLTAAKEAGFDYVEMSIDETDEKLARLHMSAAEMEEIRAAMRTTGILFGSICLSGHRKYPLGSPDPAKQVRSIEIMADAIDLAVELGIRTIQLAGYDVYYDKGTEETRAAFARNLAKSALLAARSGVQLGFETMETPFMDTVEKAMHYVDLVDSPYLGVYPDSGNLTNAALIYGKSVLDDMETGRGHMVALHLKETVPGKYREIPFGTGHVDFDAIARKAWALGVRRYVGEFWYIGSADWKADLAFANTFLRRALDAAAE